MNIGEACKNDFPLLKNSDVVYLDSAASAQKPSSVLEAEFNFYTTHYSNVHRGVYRLSEQATADYDNSRIKIASFLNAKPQEVIFTRGATEGVNLVAYSWGRANIKSGDEIVVTSLEHHSNFVPWQILAKEKNANFKVVGLDEEQNFCLKQFEQSLSASTKLVAVSMLSNALGIPLPLDKIIPMAKRYGAKVVVDGAQGIVHQAVNLATLGADFFVFSGHKIYGPTGIGVLWGREELLLEMPPF